MNLRIIKVNNQMVLFRYIIFIIYILINLTILIDLTNRNYNYIHFICKNLCMINLPLVNDLL